MLYISKIKFWKILIFNYLNEIYMKIKALIQKYLFSNFYIIGFQINNLFFKINFK